MERGALAAPPFTDSIAAVSVGMVNGEPLLDLAYVEDSRGGVGHERGHDRRRAAGGGAGDRRGQTFSRAELDTLLDLAEGGVRELTAAQAVAVA